MRRVKSFCNDANEVDCTDECDWYSSYGDMEMAVPRDRNGDYEPQLIKKYQNTVTQDMEERILSMYAKGMSTGDIESHMKELYDIDISDSTISRITDKILPIVKEWQERPLEEVYALVFMDAIHYHVRSEGCIVKRAVYIVCFIQRHQEADGGSEACICSPDGRSGLK